MNEKDQILWRLRLNRGILVRRAREIAKTRISWVLLPLHVRMTRRREYRSISQQIGLLSFKINMIERGYYVKGRSGKGRKKPVAEGM
jgi:hypothetical protein